MKINPADRPAAAAVYKKYRMPFLQTVPGALSKDLLIRDNDVQVLHGFRTSKEAEANLKSTFFSQDVVAELKPLMKANPEIRIYSVP